MLAESLELNELDIQTKGRLVACVNKLTVQKREIENLVEINRTYEK
jgi:hypothetical protein